jgi:hypothetical protein
LWSLLRYKLSEGLGNLVPDVIASNVEFLTHAQDYKNNTVTPQMVSRVECGELAVRPPGINQICKINRKHYRRPMICRYIDDNGREWYGAFSDWGLLAEDTATKLKRGKLNVCTVHCVLFSPLWLKFVSGWPAFPVSS